MAVGVFERFDSRSTAVLLSTAGAFPLPILGFVAPNFIVAGGMKYLLIIWLYTAFSFGFTLCVGCLTDRQFTVLGFGGMLGIAFSAYLVTDPAATRAIVSLLAAIPAIAAMKSTTRVTGTFTAIAVTLAVTLSTLGATSMIAVVVAGGAAIITVIVPVFMVTALRRSLGTALATLATISDTDPLTGLLNRRGFLNHSEQLLHHIATAGQSIGFIMIDIDHFKVINDRHGHAAGDSVLVALATAIKAFAPAGSIISRLGGEEFVVMTAVSTPSQTTALAEAICGQAAKQCAITVSAGALHQALVRSMVGRRNIDEVVDTLTRHADQCMYAAKDAGRDNVVLHTRAAPIIWVPGPPKEPQLGPATGQPRFTHIKILRRRPSATTGSNNSGIA